MEASCLTLKNERLFLMKKSTLFVCASIYVKEFVTVKKDLEWIIIHDWQNWPNLQNFKQLSIIFPAASQYKPFPLTYLSFDKRSRRLQEDQ